MILLIDNYDSFTFNLYQYLGELGCEIVVKRNDDLTISEIEELAPEAIVISPGPGKPENAGICIEVIKQLYKKIPILGICLGHQAIGYAFGATIEKARNVMHGKISKMTHTGSYIFEYLSQPIGVMRYHSLIVKPETLAGGFKVLAKSMDDQEIMAMKHKDYPLYGLQFHPESVGTETGKQILRNFLNEIGKGNKNEGLS
ncbi:anthranilate synthase component II [Bacillus massilinigeriensis]|uniref:anthranilate synthase component II n=1 Tax=Bacillus massilionigeriensis TaxID=1805475 RepID=UPI00096B3BAF|nr:aminodeoxychorismate/anthranilate synthase component II [Bacillus massilionigeriensis]